MERDDVAPDHDDGSGVCRAEESEHEQGGERRRQQQRRGQKGDCQPAARQTVMHGNAFVDRQRAGHVRGSKRRSLAQQLFEAPLSITP